MDFIIFVIVEKQNNCGNCRLRDEFGFCEKLVVDIKRCLVEDDKSIKAYYIAEREVIDDDRTSFIVPSDFKCVHHIKTLL